MKKLSILILFFIISLLLAPNLAAQQKFVPLGDFTLESGSTIKDCRIGYRTFGTMNPEADNVILFPTWFGGTSKHLGNLVGPDKLLDSARYFVIAMDALGNGVSSSPSNNLHQPQSAFPLFSIRDMVNSQYSSLTQGLGINHLYAVVGGSMGGMQVFQWLVSYPDFIDKALAYVASPWQSGHGRLVWETELAMIENGLAHEVPLDIITEQVALVQVINAYTPEYRNRQTTPAAVTDFRHAYVKRFSSNFRPYNWASQLRAMMQHDITLSVGDKTESLPEIIMAETFIIVSATDHLVPPGPALELADIIGAETHIFSNDCGHLAPGCEMAEFVEIVHNFLH